jgi:hypothetical protein
MKRVMASVILIFLLSVCQNTEASAAEQCGIMTPLGPGCRVYVDNYRQKLHVRKQRSPVTCWAASLSNLLTYYGKNVSEQEIVRQSTGVERLADPAVLTTALNHDYTDSGGDTVTVSIVGSTDRFWNTSHDLTNADLYEALKDDTPVFYGDVNHAMILVEGVFVPSLTGPTPISGIVADPAQGMPNYRSLQFLELIGLFAATISVSS